MSNGSEPIPEIRVPGRRPSGPPGDSVVPDVPDVPPLPRRRADEDKESDTPTGAFVAPAALPVIEEIVATAPRPQTIASRASLARFGALSGSIAAVVGFTIKAVLDKLADQLQDEAVREFMSVQPRQLPDTPVRTIPEIVLTETRPQRIPQPSPLIEPGFDPGIMVPFIPRELPAPPLQPARVVPEIDAPSRPAIEPLTQPVVAPAPLEIPLQLPLTRFNPGVLPSPLVSPLPSPFATPLPFAQPFAQPQPQPQPESRPLPIAAPFAVPTTRPVASPFAQPQPEPLPQPEFAGCPPCPKCPKVDEKEEDERLQCFKKLVKEGVVPSLDEEFNWVEINCLTGQEL